MPTPFCRMRTRSPSRPRITGRLALGPKYVAPTPGRWLMVSPRVPAARSLSCASSSTETGGASSNRLLRRGLPVTVTSGGAPSARRLCAQGFAGDQRTSAAKSGRRYAGMRFLQDCNDRRMARGRQSGAASGCRRAPMETSASNPSAPDFCIFRQPGMTAASTSATARSS